MHQPCWGSSVQKNEKMTSAFAPGNISCIFKIIPDAEPTRMHSLGMGFTVKEGVTVTVSTHDETKILFNGQEIDFPTVRAVIHKLSQRAGTTQPNTVKAEIHSPLPLGCGFGLSGASALATAYALNEQFGLREPNEALAMIAHVAEVENRTGLGDVCSQYHGGCLAKLKEGAPLVAERVPHAEEQPIYYRYFSPIQTSEVLANPKQVARINRAADTALTTLKQLVEQSSKIVLPSQETAAHIDMFNACLAVSKQFTVESGLLREPQVIRTIAQVEARGGVASMIMLGNGVFSTHAFDAALETRLCLNPAHLIRA